MKMLQVPFNRTIHKNITLLPHNCLTKTENAQSHIRLHLCFHVSEIFVPYVTLT